MEHRRYNKIHRYGSDENEGILDEGRITVPEKIDGANTSVWKADNKFILGSRNLVIEDGFNGFKIYVHNHEGIKNLLNKHSHFRLYGEWLVKHTISYNSLSYEHFYLFDIWDEEQEEFLDPKTVIELADLWGIKRPKIFYEGPVISIDKIMEYVGKSDLGERGEGVVIKNSTFVNKFGDTPAYAKIVTESFKENNGMQAPAEPAGGACNRA